MKKCSNLSLKQFLIILCILSPPVLILALSFSSNNNSSSMTGFFDFASCIDMVNRSQPVKTQNWTEWSIKPETIALREKEYFGTVSENIDAFSDVYRKNIWGSGSGAGSSINGIDTQTTICYLYAFIIAHKVDVLIDTSCGDQQWAPLLRKIVGPRLKYIGIDVVPALIQHNREKYAKKGQVEFFLLDLTEPDFFQKIGEHSEIYKPQDENKTTVLTLTRHTFYHLTDIHIQRSLVNLMKSKASYVAITNNAYHPLNARSHMKPGGWSPVNLEREPFHLYPPHVSWRESSKSGEAELAVWIKDDISLVVPHRFSPIVNQTL